MCRERGNMCMREREREREFLRRARFSFFYLKLNQFSMRRPDGQTERQLDNLLSVCPSGVESSFEEKLLKKKKNFFCGNVIWVLRFVVFFQFVTTVIASQNKNVKKNYILCYLLIEKLCFANNNIIINNNNNIRNVGR